MTRNFLTVVSVITIALFTISCEKEEDEPVVSTGTLTLDIDNLMQLDDDELYEGWIIVGGSPISTGTFSVDASGDLSKTSFSVDAKNLSAATDFVLSIEPNPDTDPAPSAIKILGGSFSGSDASISSAHGAALGSDFGSVAGKYILATPTTTTTDDELSGIWFLDLSGGAPALGLTLPELPTGWVYEGWAVIDGTPVTSGTFTMADMADDAAPFSDADGPPFPGEDFVTNAPSGLTFPTDLSGATFVISIEPSPDNSPAPFVFKPLAGTAPENSMDHITYDMASNVSASFPVGSVKR